MGSIIEDVILPLLMIIGPVIPFVPQAVLMHKEKSLGNFSIATCFVLWNANFLRILFWYLIIYLLCSKICLTNILFLKGLESYLVQYYWCKASLCLWHRQP